MTESQVGVDRAEAIAFIKEQNDIYGRTAWIDRCCGWLCGWGATTLASLAALSASGKIFEKHPTYPVWFGFTAAALTAINQTVKFEVLADAYYKGHIVLDTVLGSFKFGKATIDDLDEAWKQAQAGLPSVNRITVPSPEVASPRDGNPPPKTASPGDASPPQKAA